MAASATFVNGTSAFQYAPVIDSDKSRREPESSDFVNFHGYQESNSHSYGSAEIPYPPAQQQSVWHQSLSHHHPHQQQQHQVPSWQDGYPTNVDQQHAAIPPPADPFSSYPSFQNSHQYEHTRGILHRTPSFTNASPSNYPQQSDLVDRPANVLHGILDSSQFPPFRQPSYDLLDQSFSVGPQPVYEDQRHHASSATSQSAQQQHHFSQPEQHDLRYEPAAAPRRSEIIPNISHTTASGREASFSDLSINDSATPLTSIQQQLKPYVSDYLDTPDRVAYGERSLIIMTSKVAQKSYKSEKRFFCPPPACMLIGHSWWSHSPSLAQQQSKPLPPNIVIAIDGEADPPEDGSIEWHTANGMTFDDLHPRTNTAFVGRVIGKHLFISDDNEKRKHVDAVVRITAPATSEHPEHLIGAFTSRPIKVISKPSKKKQSTKNLELCINHGSTVALFHRLRSQTMSTKYLCVSGNVAYLKGSDGVSLFSNDQQSRAQKSTFTPRTSSWDSFFIYIVDANKPIPDHPPPLTTPPTPPPNAIPLPADGTSLPLYYNQTVVLQCMLSGIVTPTLIIRRVDVQTSALGGGTLPNHTGAYCAPGEVHGDPVSQLHKIAFEIYGEMTAPILGTQSPGTSGAFLCCLTDRVATMRPVSDRQWRPLHHAPSTHPENSPSPRIKSSPLVSQSSLPTLSPVMSSATPNEFYGGNVRESPSPPPSHAASSGPPSAVAMLPTLADFNSTHDGGRVKRPKRSMSISSGLTPVAGPRKRGNSESSGLGTRSRRNSTADALGTSGALWQVDVGETSVWTIVGTEQVRYDFYVPPIPRGATMQSVTPFPRLCKYVPTATGNHGHHGQATRNGVFNEDDKEITLYGEKFPEHGGYQVFFGKDPASCVQRRCNEAMGCVPPVEATKKGSGPKAVTLVREDGLIMPTPVIYRNP